MTATSVASKSQSSDAGNMSGGNSTAIVNTNSIQQATLDRISSRFKLTRSQSIGVSSNPNSGGGGTAGPQPNPAGDPVHHHHHNNNNNNVGGMAGLKGIRGNSLSASGVGMSSMSSGGGGSSSLSNEGRPAQVVLLDERRLELTVQPRLCAGELLDLVAGQCGLKEKEYFGLAVVDENGHYTWLQLDRRVLDHDLPRKPSLLTVHFLVKFFIESISHLADNQTVELFYLQARSLIWRGLLEVESDVVFQLAALGLQANHGDYADDPTTRGLLKKTTVLPSYVLKEEPSHTHCEDQVIEHYKKTAGQTRGQAIVNYMTIVESMPTYGVHYFEVYDKRSTPWWIGLSCRGIAQYKHTDRKVPVRVFQWKQLENLYFRDKKFSIEVHDAKRVVQTLSSFNLYEDAAKLDSQSAKDELVNAIADSTTQVSVSRRTFNPGNIHVYVWYAQTSSLTKCIWQSAISQHQFYLDRKQARMRGQAAHRTLKEIARDLTRSSASLSSASSTSNLSLSGSSHSVAVSGTGCNSHDQKENELTEDAKRARAEMVSALKARREALEEKLREKRAMLKEICIKEGELTGQLPPEIPLTPGEEPPVIRRRIGTEFQISEKLLNKSASPEEEQLAQLELELEIQSKITSAAFKLASDTSARKNVRRQRKISYNQSQKRLKELELKVATLKQSAGARGGGRGAIRLSAAGGKQQPRPVSAEGPLRKGQSLGDGMVGAGAGHLFPGTQSGLHPPPQLSSPRHSHGHSHHHHHHHPQAAFLHPSQQPEELRRGKSVPDLGTAASLRGSAQWEEANGMSPDATLANDDEDEDDSDEDDELGPSSSVAGQKSHLRLEDSAPKGPPRSCPASPRKPQPQEVGLPHKHHPPHTLQVEAGQVRVPTSGGYIPSHVYLRSSYRNKQYPTLSTSSTGRGTGNRPMRPVWNPDNKTASPGGPSGGLASQPSIHQSPYKNKFDLNSGCDSPVGLYNCPQQRTSQAFSSLDDLDGLAAAGGMGPPASAARRTTADAVGAHYPSLERSARKKQKPPPSIQASASSSGHPLVSTNSLGGQSAATSSSSSTVGGRPESRSMESLDVLENAGARGSAAAGKTRSMIMSANSRLLPSGHQLSDTVLNASGVADPHQIAAREKALDDLVYRSGSSKQTTLNNTDEYPVSSFDDVDSGGARPAGVVPVVGPDGPRGAFPAAALASIAAPRRTTLLPGQTYPEPVSAASATPGALIAGHHHPSPHHHHHHHHHHAAGGMFPPRLANAASFHMHSHHGHHHHHGHSHGHHSVSSSTSSLSSAFHNGMFMGGGSSAVTTTPPSTASPASSTAGGQTTFTVHARKIETTSDSQAASMPTASTNRPSLSPSIRGPKNNSVISSSSGCDSLPSKPTPSADHQPTEEETKPPLFPKQYYYSQVKQRLGEASSDSPAVPRKLKPSLSQSAFTPQQPHSYVHSPATAASMPIGGPHYDPNTSYDTTGNTSAVSLPDSASLNHAGGGGHKIGTTVHPPSPASHHHPAASPATSSTASGFVPYRETTKPFEMADFYKYSTKFRKASAGSLKSGEGGERDASDSQLYPGSESPMSGTASQRSSISRESIPPELPAKPSPAGTVSAVPAVARMPLSSPSGYQPAGGGGATDSLPPDERDEDSASVGDAFSTEMLAWYEQKHNNNHHTAGKSSSTTNSSTNNGKPATLV